MPTYSISEFKAKASEILSNLKDGDEVIITRRGKPCGVLKAPPPPKDPTKTIADLREALAGKLPDATWEDFQEIKKMWGRFPEATGQEDSRGE